MANAELQIVNGTKKCGKCGKWLPIECFNVNRRNKSGLQGKCKECQSAYEKAYRRRLKEKTGWVDGRSKRAKLFNEDGLKECHICKRMLPRECYHRKRRTKSGYSYECKECARVVAGRVKKYDEFVSRKVTETNTIINGTKKCVRCGKRKPISEFYEAKNVKCGLRGRCKDCDKQVSCRSFEHSVKSFLRSLIICRKRDKISGTTLRRRSLANKCELTENDLLDIWNKQQGRCAITGIEMTHIRGRGRVRENVSIDRIDNSKGYTKDNVRLVCAIVNIMRSDMPDKEFVKWCRAVVDGFCLASKRPAFRGQGVRDE